MALSNRNGPYERESNAEVLRDQRAISKPTVTRTRSVFSPLAIGAGAASARAAVGTDGLLSPRRDSYEDHRGSCAIFASWRLVDEPDITEGKRGRCVSRFDPPLLKCSDLR